MPLAGVLLPGPPADVGWRQRAPSGGSAGTVPAAPQKNFLPVEGKHYEVSAESELLFSLVQKNSSVSHLLVTLFYQQLVSLRRAGFQLKVLYLLLSLEFLP